MKNLILIVDDSLDNQTLLSLILTTKGFDVYCASNGAEALLLLGELPRLPDLILLDAQMPVMNGYQFRAQQQQTDRFKNIPVLIMSGDNDAQMNSKMLNPLGILIKPLQIQSVLNIITTYLNPETLEIRD